VLLEDKVAVVYGAAGYIGRAVSTAFARRGAAVALVGRRPDGLADVAEEIEANGGRAWTAIVDATDPAGVERHLSELVEREGRIDVSFNATTYRVVQNIPLTEMALVDFQAPIVGASRTHFVTATAAARRMSEQGSGAIILLSSSASYETRHQMGGFNVACAAIEALVRGLAGEVGPKGVRVVGVRPNLMPETAPGLPDAYIGSLVKDTTLGRLPRLSELAGTAAFLASDAAGAMSGTVLNLSCGAIPL
jgi:NAD(P)-dependent dehydrogenase (short-subunit alcohol dehydrogenase family)